MPTRDPTIPASYAPPLTEPRTAVPTIGTTGITGTFTANEATLRSRFVAGGEVRAQDIMILYAMYRQARDHTHSMQDLRGIKTTGNLNTYTTTGTYVTSVTTPTRAGPAIVPGLPGNPAGTPPVLLFGDSGAALGASPPTFRSTGADVIGTEIAAFVAAVNSTRTHFHEWNDVTT